MCDLVISNQGLYVFHATIFKDFKGKGNIIFEEKTCLKSYVDIELKKLIVNQF